MIYILVIVVFFISTGLLLSRYEVAKQRRERRLRLQQRTRRSVYRNQK